MLCCECGPRGQPEMQTPRARRLGANGDHSPVSAYCTAELDPEERKAYAQLQARNHELRWMLGVGGTSGVPMPDVDQQVKDHIARLRAAVTENTRLRHDLVQVQTALSEHGMPLVSPSDSNLSRGAQASAQASSCPSEIDAEEQERQSALIMAEIQSITQSNIELMSQYDEQVKALEAEVAAERRRQQLAEVQTKMPPSCRSLPPTPPRTSQNLDEMATPQGTAAEDDARQLDDLRDKRNELRQLEEECTRLEEAIQAELQNREQAKARALQELQLAHEVQREELAHFQRLVEEKRQRGASAEKPSTPGTDPRGLLEAELQQLREHLRDAQQRGEQERAAAEAQANELRWELQTLREEQRAVAAERETSFREIEEVKRASDGRRTPPSTSERPLELQKMHGEALAKEIERTRKRIELLDAKVEQLESEMKDIRQRANMVLRAVPDREIGGTPNSPEAAARIADLQAQVAEREAALKEAKKEEERLQEELATVQKALEAANVEARVMEQKMSLLQSRTEI